jgi:hypothetical protein
VIERSREASLDKNQELTMEARSHEEKQKKKMDPGRAAGIDTVKQKGNSVFSHGGH